MPKLVATDATQRISNIDLTRGVALMGILVMNIVSFALLPAAYLNISLPSDQTLADKAIAIAGEIFVDQKMMGVFSALFGAGIVMFADRAAAKGKSGFWLSIWRNALLFAIGVIHIFIWGGDILTLYGLSAPVIILLRKLSPIVLTTFGATTLLLSIPLAVAAQSSLTQAPSEWGELWLADGGAIGWVPFFWVILDGFARAIGMMLIGAAAYKSGLFSSSFSRVRLKRIGIIGTSTSWVLAASGVVWLAVENYSPSAGAIATLPNAIGTPFGSLGYMSVICLWGQSRHFAKLQARVVALGRMALTNYLCQSLIGVGLVNWVGGSLLGIGWTRTTLLLVVASVWLVQLLLSKPWIDRFKLGPIEWGWRFLTYFGNPRKTATQETQRIATAHEPPATG